jgi:hypothetical protein
VTILDSALLEPQARSRALVAELKSLHLAYLAACISRDG